MQAEIFSGKIMVFLLASSNVFGSSHANSRAGSSKSIFLAGKNNMSLDGFHVSIWNMPLISIFNSSAGAKPCMPSMLSNIVVAVVMLSARKNTHAAFTKIKVSSQPKNEGKRRC